MVDDLQTELEAPGDGQSSAAIPTASSERAVPTDEAVAAQSETEDSDMPAPIAEFETRTRNHDGIGSALM